MHQKNKSTSILLYGQVRSSNEDWSKWYKFAIELANCLGFIPSHINVRSSSFKSDKLLNIKRTEKKLKKVIEEGEDFDYLGIDSLPDDYGIASFDYDFSIIRNRILEPSHILLTFRRIHISVEELELKVNMLKEHIEFQYGEIFELDTSELPEIYAVKGKPLNAFSGLRILRTL